MKISCRFLPLWFLVLLATTPGGSLFAQDSSRRPGLPNIIYIYADDLGYGELGSYGQKKIRTPHLDRMAAEGMRFTSHYAGAPVCAPSRAILMTGKHAGHSFIRGNYELGGFEDSSERGQMPLPDKAFTIARLLKQRGYATGLVGKWGLGMQRTEGNPCNHGFDYYYGYLDQKQAHNHYPTHLWENDQWDTLRQPYQYVHRRLDPATATEQDFNAFRGVDYAPGKMTEKALAFIDLHQKEPFFLYLPYSLPHVSLQVPDEWTARYIGQFPERPYYGENGYAPHLYPLSAYAAMISFLDAQAGLILEKLKALGLDENTLVLFSSDNGTTFNTGGVDAAYFNSVAGLRGWKADLYEGGIRVPFIARWPGHIAAGKTSAHLSAQYDLMATLAELTGQEPPHNDGLSFLPELTGRGTQLQHKYLYFEYPDNGGQVAIRMGKWKAVKTNLKKDPKAPWQLFDLEADPGETRNLASSNRRLLHKFSRIVRREHIHSVVLDWEIVD